jgi:hypothetical protein
MLLEALLSGEHALHGFTNRDLRHKLARTSVALATDPLKQSAQVTRLLWTYPDSVDGEGLEFSSRSSSSSSWC